MKLLLVLVYSLPDWLVFSEEGLCDAIAVKAGADGWLHTVACEAERTLRNFSRNLLRNLRDGHHRMLVLVPSDSLARAARRRLRREFSREIQIRVGIVTVASLRNALARRPSSLSSHGPPSDLPFPPTVPSTPKPSKL